jgi:hypothetical protein
MDIEVIPVEGVPLARHLDSLQLRGRFHPWEATETIVTFVHHGPTIQDDRPRGATGERGIRRFTNRWHGAGASGSRDRAHPRGLAACRAATPELHTGDDSGQGRNAEGSPGKHVIADFRDLLASFVACGVRFLVVGAHALAAHGVPRVTGDMDLWVETSVDNAARIWRALAEFGAPLETLGIEESAFTTPDQVIQLGLPPYRIDVMTSISGVSFEEAWAERMRGDLYGVPVEFIGRAAFIRNKRSSGRPKDLQDIRSLGN